MHSPFPGMDPYLEHPSLWPDVHNRLITAIADALTPLVAPRYYIGLERRAYLLRLDYNQPPVPPPSEEDAGWANELSPR